MSNIEYFETAGQGQYEVNNDAVAESMKAAEGINDSAQASIAMKNKNLLEKNSNR